MHVRLAIAVKLKESAASHTVNVNVKMQIVVRSFIAITKTKQISYHFVIYKLGGSFSLLEGVDAS